MTITSPTLSRLCGTLLLAMAGSACSGVGSAPPAASTPAPAPTLLAQLRAEIGAAACDNNGQCQTIAVGHKACGGPESYLAWSSKAGNGAAIRRLAEAHGAQRKAENLASGMMSTCSAVMDPGASCTAGRCVTGGGNPAI
jgi:hypothetical protein